MSVCDCEESKKLGMKAMVVEKLVQCTPRLMEKIAKCAHCGRILDVKEVRR